MRAPSYFACGTDATPLTVFLNTEVIQGINAALAETARDASGRGIESGGILLGTVEYTRPGHPVVSIDHFEPFASEHRRGASYILTDRNKFQLSRRLLWLNRSRKGGLRPVGFYRSHTRRGLYLDNDDFFIMRACFSEVHSVFLLVRPEAGEPATGGFFYWENGDIHRESSRMEFIFDPARLPLLTPEPAPSPAPRRRAPLDLRPAAIPAAAVLLFVLAFYAVRSIMLRQPHPHPQVNMVPAPVAPPVIAQTAPAPPPSPPVEKPSPIAKKPAPVRRSTGGASRRAPDPELTATTPVVQPAPPTARVEVSPPPQPPVMAAIDVPARVEAPPARVASAPVATVTIEPVGQSKIGRVIRHIPGFRHKKQAFVPARLIRQVTPKVPPSHEIDRDVPVDLRITVDPVGNVASVEPSRGGDRQLVRLASEAALNWHFEPARRNDESVSSELILHFTFRPPATQAQP